MGEPANLPRQRALRAALLALLLATVGLASVVLAKDPADGSGSVTFGVPQGRVGDAWEYGTEWTTVPEDHIAHNVTTAAEWLEPAQLYDLNGTHHYTNNLWYAPRSEGAGTLGNSFYLMHLEQVGGRVIGTTLGSSFSTGVGTAFDWRVEKEEENRTKLYDAGRAPEAPPFAPCGSLHPLQGAQRDLSVPVRFDPCSIPGVGWIPASAYSLTHIEDVGEGPRIATLRLDANETAGIPDEGGVRVVEYRFREDLAYPLSMDFERRDGSAGTLRLDAFERGDQPIGDSASMQPPLPRVEFAPSPAWGLDDSGIDHPYPLSAAWQDALSDPRHGLRLFLETHPDAYVARTAFDVIYRDATTEHWWSITVTDGEDWTTVCPSRISHDGAADEGLPALPLGEPARTRCIQYGGSAPQSYTPPERPTIASMQNVWDALAPLLDLDEPLLDYGLYVGSEGYERYHAGSAGARESLTGPVTGFRAEDRHANLEFRADGRLEFVTVKFEERTYGPAGSEVPPPSGARPAAATFIPLATSAFTAPTSAEAGTVGLIALLAALLYGLWPWLKQLLILPLFSRIQKPRILDHERRQRIVAAIEAEPGIDFGELRRRTGLARGALRHHLNMLLQNEVIGQRKANGYTCYHARPEDARVVDAQAVARSPMARRVLDAWRQRPDASGAELAEVLGASRQTVHYHVKRLSAAGLAPASRD